MYMKVRGAVNRSRPGVPHTTPWPALSDDQQREMDQVVAMLNEAANQGHTAAQVFCGLVHQCGWGVKKDDHLAFTYYEKGAQQGHAECQRNIGIYYFHGQGCERSHERAAQWLEKAALQGNADAMFYLGLLCAWGKGVPQNPVRAFELWTNGAWQGETNAQIMLILIFSVVISVWFYFFRAMLVSKKNQEPGCVVRGGFEFCS